MNCEIINQFEKYLIAENYKDSTIKNYTGVINEYHRYTNNYLISKDELYSYLIRIQLGQVQNVV